MVRRIAMTCLVLVTVLAGANLFAQGQQTATLEGTVTTSDGSPLPGVTVTVKSPALMGDRTAVTASTGDYVLRGLPPGDYSVTFSLEGMKAVTTRKNLPLGLTSRVDAAMKVAAVTEAITVTASSPTALETQTVGANIKAETVQQLPLLRTPTDIASLSPGVTGDRGGRATTPVGGQISINGGMAYDNNLMINGVNFQDNIFGNTNNLFVEDAIQETQVLTSGISAEYGHFTGGVVNVITKSGGNQFTGSFRDNLSKPSWTALTPYEKGFRGNGVTPAKEAKHIGKLSNVYEATLGGPIWRDRLWFFLAGRKEASSTANNLPVTGIGYTVQQGNKRPEIKLTANLGAGHTIQGDWLDNPVTRNLEVQVTPLTMSAVGTNSVRENRGYSLFYNGVLTNSLFAEARYAQKHFGFRGLGGKLTDIHDSPFRSSTRVTGVATAGTFNGTYFDATDPEDRDNEQAYAALSYFMSRPTIGSHDIKGGYERFIDTRTGGNSQSATSYVFYGGYQTQGGNAVINNGELVPLFNPRSGGVSQETRIGYWVSTRGAKLDTTTDTLFINDRWNLNQHFNFNIGARYEKTKSEATGGIVGIDTDNIVPRLGASYDVTGTGKYKVDVTYAQYVGRYNPAIVGANTPVGVSALLYGYYTGPQGAGRDFAPGFDVNNYHFYYARVPTANVFFDKGLHAPVTNEWSVSTGMAFTSSAWAKATYTDRRYRNFIETFITHDLGCTNITLGGISAGCADNILYKNTNGPRRLYQAVELQSHYDILRNWAIEGNWTHQIKNHGNYEGEAGQSITTSAFGDRPEIQSPRELPYGRLAQFEANRVRMWTTYNLGLSRAGNLSLGLLYRYDSPLTFSYNASVSRSAQSKAKDPGYKSAGNSVGITFGERGAGQYASSSLFDTSIQYSLPIARVTPWVKFDVRNVFNKDTQILWNTTVTADANSPKDEFGYATGYTKAATFGRPRSTNDYVRPREYLVYVGVRF